jgi:hypothetical protein
MANQNQKIILKSGLFDKILFSKKIINPRRDWTVLVIFLFILIIGALAFDGLMYEKIASGEMYVSVERSELNLQPLHVGAMQQVISDYQSRAENISSIRTKNFIDPSL